MATFGKESTKRGDLLHSTVDEAKIGNSRGSCEPQVFTSFVPATVFGPTGLSESVGRIN